jgi:signal transduction histidine kinase/DNA-binding response OmpR family regulator
MQINDRKRLRNVIFAAVVGISVILAFVLFIQDNNKRAVALSQNYLKDATAQARDRIDEGLENAVSTIHMTAALYEEMLKTPEVNAEDMQILTEKADFDAVEFADADGLEIDAEGTRTDVSETWYYQDGIQGNSGIDVVFNADNTGENLIIFYTPMYYEEEIIGVLLGHYRENKIQEILYSTFFGEDARTYVCLQDGSIIASYNGEYLSETIFDTKSFAGNLIGNREGELKEALSSRSEYEFQYNGTAGTGNAYVTPLKNSEWLLIQTFPSQVTTRMVQNANRAGEVLLAELIAIFVVCLVVLQVMSARQKKKLILENAEKSWVVNGITQLFGTFVMADLEKGTYQYIAGTKPRMPDFPLEGDYNALKDMIAGMVEDEEEKKHLSTVLMKDVLQRNLDASTSCLRYEYKIKSEKEEWDSLNLICLSRIDGIARRVLITYQDVTTVKKRELRSYDALKEAYQAVESANHAKSDFLSNMSHDIRTPMNAIMGMTAIAAMNVDNPERVKDCLNKITVSSQHLLGLINEVLDMSKIESGKMSLSEEEFNLSDVVDHIVTMFYPQTKAKGQTFRMELSNVTHEDVIGDSMRLQQIFVNILGNAVKFTQEGGTITFLIKEKPSGMHGCGCYEFTFEDNGIGMEESYLEKLFEPFVRADNSRTGKVEGTGLGMPIVKNIVQMMNGTIEVESKVNEGSKFIITVYLKLNHFKKEDTSGLENLTVLVADDDGFACESACAVLKEIGMEADWVLSGDEAIGKLLKAQEEKREYAVVILDWKMPGKDGIETAREIRAKVGKDVPIIILSAFDYSDVEQEAREAGINAFISKPLFRSRLVYVLKSLMLEEEKKDNEIDRLKNSDHSGKRVLLVEDQEINMEIAEELLKQTGVSVDKAFNGREAVEQIMKMPEGYYQLVFMDIRMPEMNGYEAAAAIRASGREDLKTLPILAMSADAFTDDVEHAKKAGMNGHVAKPVEIGKLVKALEEWT